MVSIDLSQKEGPGFRSIWSCPLCVEFACSSCVHMGFQPKDIHVRLIGHSKLSVGVNVSVFVCVTVLYPPINNKNKQLKKSMKIETCHLFHFKVHLFLSFYNTGLHNEMKVVALSCYTHRTYNINYTVCISSFVS